MSNLLALIRLCSWVVQVPQFVIFHKKLEIFHKWSDLIKIVLVISYLNSDKFKPLRQGQVITNLSSVVTVLLGAK